MSEFPHSLREINQLPQAEKEEIYSHLIPSWLLEDYSIDPETFMNQGNRVVQFRCPEKTRALEITVKRYATDIDPIMYLNMADTFNGQLLVLLVVVNDPDAKRYHIDVDESGNRTNFGTSSRNIPAEIEAMKAGLSPGQIRKGLRVFRQTLPMFENFVDKMGHDMFLIEPLSYHNAIAFEGYGFNYMKGLADMKKIHQAFLPEGDLYQKLTPTNPFRQPDAWKTVRGRSWAIHDGILGYPFTGFQMYKRLGHNANVNSFPDALW
ncbi:hypothetical protein MASR2M15_13150 [Anaerolineales bacterium]